MLCSVIAPPLLQASRQLLPKRSSAALLYHVDVHVAPGGSISSVPDVGFSCLLRPKENGDRGLFNQVLMSQLGCSERGAFSLLTSVGWFHVTDPGCRFDLSAAVVCFRSDCEQQLWLFLYLSLWSCSLIHCVRGSPECFR